MAIKAIFVGINKHLDAAIPELSGARHDAMALWALFNRRFERVRDRACNRRQRFQSLCVRGRPPIQKLCGAPPDQPPV